MIKTIHCYVTSRTGRAIFFCGFAITDSVSGIGKMQEHHVKKQSDANRNYIAFNEFRNMPHNYSKGEKSLSAHLFCSK